MNKKIKKFVLIILTATFVVQVCTFASSSQIMAAGVISNGNYTISNASEEYRYKALNADLQYWTYSYNIRDEFLNWTLTYNESKNAYKITQKSNPSKALGIRADSCTTFPELKIYTNSSSNYVFWNIVKKSDNTYTLSPKMYPDKYLSCYLKTLQTETFVHFYISTKPQKWRIQN